MKKIALALLTVLLVGAAPASSQESPAAVIVKVQGDVQVRPDGGDPTPAAVGTRLSIGDQILPGSGQAVVVSRTGSTRTVTETVTIQAPSAGDEGDMFARTVQVLAQAATTDARSQPNRQGMIRPIPGQPTPVAPRNRLTVMDVRPTFRWHRVEGAEGYTLQIRREGGTPVRFQAGPDTAWTLPESAGALERGATYFWTVAPSGTGRPAREQPFTVASEEAYRSVSDNLESLAAAGLDPDDDGLFLAAVVYREAGFYYEAARALQSLNETGTPMSAEAYFLLGEVLDTLGRVDEAQAAFDRGDRMTGP